MSVLYKIILGLTIMYEYHNFNLFANVKDNFVIFSFVIVFL